MGRNSKIVIAVIIVLALGILVFRGCHSNPPPSAEETSNENSEDQEQMAEPAPTATPVATPPPTSATPSAPIEVDRNALAQKFAAEMRNMQACFSLIGTTEDSVEPSAENLDNVVREEMGEVVAKNLDWSSSYIETSSGERRLIRTEIDYNGDESSARKLKYFSIGTDGFLNPIPLGPEQQDPSDALIASLETEGHVILRERNTRAYYTNGGEVSYLEKDGVLADIEVSYNGRTFRCNNLQTLQGTCACH